METNSERLDALEKKLDLILQKIIDVYDTILTKEIKYNSDICDIYGASKITGLTVSTIRKRCKEETIPFIRRKNKVYFSRNALMDWLGDWEYHEAKRKKAEAKKKEIEKRKADEKYWD